MYDIAIIGGGINGCGIARDAAGRGLKVFLAEQSDLASGTSSASTKLVHGGLRYLEHYEFLLVRQSLKEREVLWSMAPHIIWPLRFVLPHHKALRPAWLIRIGLFLYDHLGGRKLLPASHSVDLAKDGGRKAVEGRLHAGLRIFRLLGRRRPSRRAQRHGCARARRSDYNASGSHIGAPRRRRVDGRRSGEAHPENARPFRPAPSSMPVDPGSTTF